jgi:hypothetical protein
VLGAELAANGGHAAAQASAHVLTFFLSFMNT